MSDGSSAPKGTLEMSGQSPEGEEPATTAEPPMALDAPEATADTADADPLPAKKPPPTVVDEPAAPTPAEDAPWNQKGKTQPGEPPVFFPEPTAPAAAASPAFAPAAPPAPAMMAPPPAAPMMHYAAPMPMAVPQRGSNMGLIVGSLVGALAVLGGVIAIVIVMRGQQDDEPTQTIPLSNPGTTEVKPEAPMAEDPPAASPPAEPAPAPAPAPQPKPAAVTPKPKATATATPSALPPPPPPATAPPPQPTTPPDQPPLPTPPPAKTGGGRLKWPNKPK